MIPLSGIDIASILPFSIVVFAAIVVLFLEVFQRPSQSRGYLAGITAGGFGVAAAVALLLTSVPGSMTFGGTAALDAYTQVMTVVFCLGGAMAALSAPRYLEAQSVDRGEFYALLLFAVSGMIIMAASTDLITLFIGIEIQSVSAYALTAYLRPSGRSAEAGLKYFLLGAVASALLLYGMAMLYGATGSTNLVAIGEALSGAAPASGEQLAERALDGLVGFAQGVDPSGGLAWHRANGALPIAALGLVFVIVALATKVAAAPFHMWAPDAYTGAPTPAAGFLASSVKLAGFAGLLRLLSTALFSEEARIGEFGWVQIVLWIALLSMVVGNLSALLQTNLKRMLAFSSVAHAGYLMVGVAALGHGAGNADAIAGVVVYGFAYTLSTIGAFAVIAWFAARDRELETLEDLNGLGQSHPWAGAALTVFLLSTAGFPGTIGFIGKFMLFRDALVSTSETPGSLFFIVVIVAGLLASVVGAAYYFRAILHLYARKPRREVVGLNDSGARMLIVAAALLTLWFGLVPGRIVDLGRDAAQGLLGRFDGGYIAPSGDGDDTAE
jgi:NADH-quinone oxidoreductase subunit N